MINTIRIKERLDKDLKNVLLELQKEHSDKVEGIYELYDSLYLNGKCETYSEDRMYYVAYTLATKGVNFKVNNSLDNINEDVKRDPLKESFEEFANSPMGSIHFDNSEEQEDGWELDI